MSSFISDIPKKMMGQPWYSKKVTSEPSLKDVAISGLFPGQGAMTGAMYLGNKYSEATTPKIPKPPAPAAADKPAEQEAARLAAQSEADRIRKRRGMGQTIITGQSGVTQPAPTFKTTLG